MTRDNGAVAADGATNPEPPQWEPSPPDAIAMWLAGKTPADFDAIEAEGRVMYPEVIRRRDPKSDALQEVPIYLRTPTTLEQVRARVEALVWVQKAAKLKERPTMDQAEAIFGREYFDSIDTLFLLERCIFDREPLKEGGAYAPYMLAEHLDKLHPKAALHDVYQRLSFYQAIEDPRIHELTENEFSQAVAAIAKVRNLSPLVAIDGRAHASFFVSMADRLTSSPTPSSS